jgi:hypothetical protein
MKLLYLENRGEVDTMLDIVALIGCPLPPFKFSKFKSWEVRWIDSGFLVV